MKIAIADDYAKSYNTTIDWLKKQGFTVLFHAKNGHDLLKQLNTQKILPKIVLMDVKMKPIDGCAATYYIKHHYPAVKILALSGYLDATIIKQVIVCGADGFINKANREEILRLAINEVLSGNNFIDPRFLDLFKDITLQSIFTSKERFWKKFTDTDTDTDTDTGRLTARERTFIMLAATQLNNHEIAELMNITVRTVETMYTRVSKKLEVKNQKELLLFALQNGLAVNADFSFIEDAQQVA
jgi:DNA-binding NarL/FixJ family response regulator